MQGAIIIVGPGSATAAAKHSLHSNLPLACVEVLGRSALDRQISDLRKIGIDAVVLLADRSLLSVQTELEQATNVPFTWVDDVSVSAAQQLAACKVSGFGTVVLIRANGYAELDFQDVMQFHREEAEGLTRVISSEGPIDIWAIDTAIVTDANPLSDLLRSPEGARYWCRGYVNRLQNGKDLRRLVADSFNGSCRLRPEGQEVRPGVWIAEGADVHRGARIVTPAYIGRGSKVQEQCLVTRCSNIESNCRVDYGTVIEDSTILPNTYVGIGLDISHCVVNGSHLLNLERDVRLEISDPGVVRANKVLRKEVSRPVAHAFGLVGMRQ